MATELELFEKAKGDINAAFPDLACLRCGYKKFGLTVRKGTDSSGLYTNSTSAKFDLTCERCGKVETFDSRFLEKAPKPVISGDFDG